MLPNISIAFVSPFIPASTILLPVSNAPQLSRLCLMKAQTDDVNVPSSRALIHRVANQMRGPAAFVWASEDTIPMREHGDFKSLLKQFPREHELSKAFLMSVIDTLVKDECEGQTCGVIVRRDDATAKDILKQIRRSFGSVSHQLEVYQLLQQQINGRDSVYLVKNVPNKLVKDCVEVLFSKKMILDRIINQHKRDSVMGEGLPLKLLRFFVTMDPDYAPAAGYLVQTFASLAARNAITKVYQRTLELRGYFKGSEELRDAIQHQIPPMDQQLHHYLADVRDHMGMKSSELFVQELDRDQYPDLSRSFLEKVAYRYAQLSMP